MVAGFMRIPVGDFKIGSEEIAAVNEVLESGHITEGVSSKAFEKEFAKFLGVKHTVALNSGTSALIAGLEALKHIESRLGTLVITSPLSYVATSNAIVKSGLNPVYGDVDPQTFVITPQSISQLLEDADDASRFSIILPVHLMGYPCDMEAINRIARNYGLQVFEDSAQAHGTLYKGKRTGSLSLLAAFSFYVAHNIQAGELGALATNDFEIDRIVNKLKAHGRSCDCQLCVRPSGRCPKPLEPDPRFTHDIIGYNFKTTDIQAALARTQLRKAEWIMRRRQENVKYLNEHLESFQDVLQLPEYSDNVSYLAYCVVVKRTSLFSREKLRIELERNGVETRPLFACIPTQQPAFSYLRDLYTGRLPIAEFLGRNAFYVGCHQYLDDEDLGFIVKQFKRSLKKLC